MKRIISIITTVVILVAMSVSVFAASPGVPADINAKTFQEVLKKNGEAGFIKLDNKAITVDKLSDLTPDTGAVLKIYLTDNMFVDNQGTAIGDPAKPKAMTRTQLRTVKLTVRRSSSKGSKILKTAGIKYDNTGAYFGLEFVDPYVGVNEQEFNINYYFLSNNKRRTGTEISLTGEFSNPVVEIYSDYDYIDLSDGTVAEAVERVSAIEVDMGNDLTLHTKMVKGKKYYATSNTDPTNADLKIMDKYPNIDTVYTLNTVNFRSTTDKVYFNIDYSLYAYNAKGEYIGTTKTKLPLSTKYYLSDKKYTSIAVK